MKKVITYGTFDLLHYGHRRLLERAKALGDYLIVGITSDDYDRTRGKINASQPLIERIDAVRALGIADEIVVEEYEGQKIDDIRRLGVDVFTVGSDWVGFFDYLKEYCQVVYLDRTDGVSSSDLRAEHRMMRLGIIGESLAVSKCCSECGFVNGVRISAVCSQDESSVALARASGIAVCDDLDGLLELCDAVYVVSHPSLHRQHIRKAIEAGKHILCESPIALSRESCRELHKLAETKGLVLMEAIKTAYTTAYNRMLLMAKTGKIGRVVSVDATCTSLAMQERSGRQPWQWNSICAWGPTALLPVFHLLGTHYRNRRLVSFYEDEERRFDAFTKIDLEYDNAVASVKVGKGVKSEGALVVSGTKGYIYVPAPWWKTDYFELRYESANDNKRFFYQLDGEGIRRELVAFAKAISEGTIPQFVIREVSVAIADMMDGKERIS